MSMVGRATLIVFLPYFVKNPLLMLLYNNKGLLPQIQHGLETMFGPFFVHPIPIIDATFCVASLMQHQSVVDLLLSTAKSDEDERLLLS